MKQGSVGSVWILGEEFPGWRGSMCKGPVVGGCLGVSGRWVAAWCQWQEVIQRL